MVAKYWKPVALLAAWVLIAVLGYVYFAGQNPEVRLKAIAPISQLEELRTEMLEVVIAEFPPMLDQDPADPELPAEMAGFKVSDQARKDFKRVLEQQIQDLSTDVESQSEMWPEADRSSDYLPTNLKVSEETYSTDWLRLRTDSQAGVSANVMLEYDVKHVDGELANSMGYSWGIEFIVDGPTQTIVSIDFPGF